MTPQEIQEQVKDRYPEYYRTASHIRNVAKGYYKDIDHALLAQIYSMLKNSKSFICDRTYKPMRFSLIRDAAVSNPRLKMSSKEEHVKNEDYLISKIDHFYKLSLEVQKEFGGPSIYFHIQAIKAQESAFLSDRHIEMIYATLASWGLQRMGSPDETKAKMIEFSDFRQSILKCREQFQRFYPLRMDSCTQEQYEQHIDNLEQVYRSLKVSIAKATIVAHSKTLAHILPNLIPPIDRQYTVRFFTQDYKDFFSTKGKFRPVSLPTDIDAQFIDFKNYCRRIKMLFDRSDSHLFSIDKETFNSSFPKIMDNLIMAFVKEVRKTFKKQERDTTDLNGDIEPM